MKLLVIADDLTGALDTGIQFSSCGIETQVAIGSNFRAQGQLSQVLVIDSETRHLTKDEAFNIVADITKEAVRAGIPYIFKKTDSALRGNIGSELEAAYKAGNQEKLIFIPAFPKMDRVTKGGVHLINGIPVDQSVFGKDPFDPVTEKTVKGIIRQQSAVAVQEVPLGECLKYEKYQGIMSFDAQTDAYIDEVARTLMEKNQLKLMAGCAGFASILPNLLDFTKSPVKSLSKTKGLLVVCGSVNPITKQQLDVAEAHGFTRIRLNHEQKINPIYWQSKEGEEKLEELYQVLKENPAAIIDSNDQESQEKTMDHASTHYGMDVEACRQQISSNLGYLLKRLVEKGLQQSLMVTGGDTLLGFMDQMKIGALEMIAEVEPGTVLSEFTFQNKPYNLISKSGGFGAEDLLLSLKNKLTYLNEGVIEHAG